MRIEKHDTLPCFDEQNAINLYMSPKYGPQLYIKIFVKKFLFIIFHLVNILSIIYCLFILLSDFKNMWTDG
jgi:hypothetical protein